MANGSNRSEIDRIIIDAINHAHIKNVLDLVSHVKERQGIDEKQVLSRIKELEKEGRIQLEKQPSHPPRRLTRYLTSRWNWEFWLVVVYSFATLLTVLSIPAGEALIPLRWLIGATFLLFIPGFSLVQALFPGEEDLNRIEKTGLSIGLSIAIIPLTAIILNYTPWKMRLVPILASLCGFTLLSIIVGSWRKYRMVKRHLGTQ